MKGQDKGKGNIADRDDWETPEWLFDKLDLQYGFFYDCCASNKNSKCIKYCDDFLNTQLIWKGDSMVAWLNPPFSKAPEMIKHFFKVVDHGVGIYRCDNMETKIWQFILNNADWVHIFDKRINYEGKTGKGAVFGSALFGVGVEPPKNLEKVTIKKLDNKGDE